MNFTPEQIASTNKAGIEAVLGLAHTQFAAFERLSALYFNATKAAFEEGVGHAKALLNAKDPQEYLNLNAAATQPTMEKAIAYSRSLYEVAAEAQSEFSRLAEERMASFQQVISESVEQAAKASPAGGDVAVAAMKSSLAATTAAFDSLNKAAKHFASYTDAGVRATHTPKSRKK